MRNASEVQDDIFSAEQDVFSAQDRVTALEDELVRVEDHEAEERECDACEGTGSVDVEWDGEGDPPDYTCKVCGGSGEKP